MTMLIEAQELRKAYRTLGEPVVAMDGVSLEIERGEFVAIMGPSGCGKSTLLNALAGFDRPDSGALFLDGEQVDGLSETSWARLRRRRIGFVFQFFNLIGNLTVADNIELPALTAGMSSGEARRRREGLTERLGISERARAVPAELSGGEQQRVAIARALVNEPDVLLADEPTGNLDSGTAREVMELLRELHGDGQTIVMVTHDPRVAAQADRVLRMRDGQIASESRLDGTTDRKRVLSDLVELGV